MGVIKQGILGGFRGSVANVVGSSWKGIAVMKSKPLSVANPRTAGQVTNRQSFSAVVAFATIILSTIIKPLLDRIAVQMSGYNFFMSLNKSLFDVTGLIVPEDLVISKGTVTGVSNLCTVADDSNETILLTWDNNTGVGDALIGDILFSCHYNEALGEVVAGLCTGGRGDATVSDPLPVNWVAGHPIHTWAAFRRADGTRSSNTAYKAGNIAS